MLLAVAGRGGTAIDGRALGAWLARYSDRVVDLSEDGEPAAFFALEQAGDRQGVALWPSPSERDEKVAWVMWVSASRSYYIVFQKLTHEIALGKTHVTHATRGGRPCRQQWAADG